MDVSSNVYYVNLKAINGYLYFYHSVKFGSILIIQWDYYDRIQEHRNFTELKLNSIELKWSYIDVLLS